MTKTNISIVFLKQSTPVVFKIVLLNMNVFAIVTIKHKICLDFVYFGLIFF